MIIFLELRVVKYSTLSRDRPRCWVISIRLEFATKGFTFDFLFLIYMITHVQILYNFDRHTFLKKKKSNRIIFSCFLRGQLKSIWLLNNCEIWHSGDLWEAENENGLEFLPAHRRWLWVALIRTYTLMMKSFLHIRIDKGFI